MIPLTRPPPPQEFLEKAPSLKQAVLDALAAGAAVKNLVNKHGNVKSARTVLFDATHDKCMYCEGKPLATGPGQVEHIYPKAVYPERAYEWSNWGPTCFWCNNNKGDDCFSSRVPILDPYRHDPEKHLEFRGLDMRGKSALGGWTVGHLRLTTFAALVKRRNDRMDDLQQLIDLAVQNPDVPGLSDYAIRFADDDQEYSRQARAVLVAAGLL